MMERLDVVIAGAGVVGLAIARAFAMAGREVFIVEAEAAIGTQTSSRNSEVIHAGIYYPRDSLKARLCVRGRQQLYRYLQAESIEYRRCGKLIVATEESQLASLEQIAAHARANGVDDIVWLDGREAQALEPALRAVAALHSPSTGIVDSHGYMLSLLAGSPTRASCWTSRATNRSAYARAPLSTAPVCRPRPSRDRSTALRHNRFHKAGCARATTFRSRAVHPSRDSSIRYLSPVVWVCI